MPLSTLRLPAQLHIFTSLRNVHEFSNVCEQYAGIARTNALPLAADGLEGGIFENACRINHACNNNTHNNWNENVGCHTVHALRDIQQGEEITIFYLRSQESRSRRLAQLKEKFLFTCSCGLCALGPKESRESDVRLEATLRLENLISRGGLEAILATPLQMLRYVDQQVQLYERHGPGDAGLPGAYFDAAQMVVAHGDLARGRVFAGRAISEWERTAGDDCKEVIQYRKTPHDPSLLPGLYGRSMEWKTAVDDVPTGLQPADFEEWLWRRKPASKKKHKKKAKNHDKNTSIPTFFTIREVPKKGQGVVASTKITKGTRILAESPLLTVPRHVRDIEAVEVAIGRQVKMLDEKKRQHFFALHNCHGDRHTPELGICRTNVLPLGTDATVGGLFLQASRINHSCRHNSQNTWNKKLGQITIHAFRDIEEGEEITICYLGGSDKYAHRQRHLKSTFGFHCSCELCMMPLDYRVQSDERREKIDILDKDIGDGMGIISSPLACLGAVRSLLKLLEEESIADATVPRAYYDAFQIAIANGDQARARVFAQRAQRLRVILQGDNGPDTRVLGKYADDPTTHRLYGTTNKWRQAVTKVPKELDAKAFEDWLWKKRR
ncbi:hypothetical protein LLEC1_02359 [Akanthomyces lecanii]|uniref:SET domain-containing protein n=1 Tax=Cordyceps confragosa TaxID=2714763 RepID=A0A179ICB5_CORDF|nr:hypothetical protein LLEC1_02359 [Akanthomyces lecanii]